MSGRAYITVVRWPKAYTLKDKVDALVDALGMDPYTAGLRAAQTPPFVVSRVDEGVSADVINRFKARRVSSFAMTPAIVDRLPKPQQIKRLVPALGAAEPMYMVEFWKGDPAGIKASEIFLLVRATVDRSTFRTTVTANQGASWGRVGGLGGLAGLGMGAANAGPDVSHTTEVKLTQLLDIYMMDRTLLRVNSDRVSFDVLGKDRGFSATENVDKLATRLGSEAPLALIDTGFGNFKPPTDVATEVVSGGGLNTSTRQRDEGSAFDFYSGWTYTINRALSAR